jgi:hypothetical protein
MGGAVELVPLVCLKCSTPVPARPDEAAWVCAQCGQAMLLDSETGLQPLVVQYAAGIPPNAQGKPYWVAEGRVTMQRATYDGNQERESAQFWSQPRRFFIPAHNVSLQELLAQGMALLRQPPALQPGPSTGFLPVVLPADDVRATAEFIIMAVEAERKDDLKEIRFDLEIGVPSLWILP